MNFDLKSFGKRLYEKINDDDILGNAAQVAFYFTFALFPLLLFLMSLIGIILSDKTDLQNQLFVILGEVMPKSAFDLVQKTLTDVTSSATGGKLTDVRSRRWKPSIDISALRLAPAPVPYFTASASMAPS